MNNSILNDVLKEYEKKRLLNTYKLYCQMYFTK